MAETKKRQMGTAIFLLLVGAGGLAFALSVGWQSVKVRSWPTATARLVTSEVVRTDTPAAGARTARFEPRVTYEFEVEGRPVQSHGLYTTTTAMEDEDAAQVIADLGDSFEVHYNPDEPTEAYVQPTSLVWPIVAGVVGILALLAGLGMLVGGGKGE